MAPRGYREEDLVSNRASLLIHGGTEDERRAWAEEAARNFGVPLTEVRQAAELPGALRQPNGVLFVADVAKLPLDAQGLILRCLQMQEERPKVVVGVSGAASAALTRGSLREDLHYRLNQAQVDLQTEGLREVLKRRWAQQAEQLAVRAAALKAAEEKERAAAVARRPGSVTRTLPKRKAPPPVRKSAPRNAVR
ncbi:sigma 54-interacting transcriptional regulator [Corallococcus sicarius]|uniref:Fis family transcriptional regulator n=1 Tax=Corallococcus sicarius TaxID=2316726 RepID=A0A3A8MZU0_9BACT|nr:sigma 54-interacting transcriptional regulator [Corallococcus sicarius]RKH37738.1 Fis family transcriptional regulator [Corallococcus sicarius]